LAKNAPETACSAFQYNPDMTSPPSDSGETPPFGDVTRVLADVAKRVPDADTRLLELVYAELKRLAAGRMGAQLPEHTLQPTALVHEAYLRLLGSQPDAPAYRSSGHFFAAAASAMRSILVDHSRRKRADRRGAGALRVTLHPELVGTREPEESVLQVHEALERFSREYERAAKVVELLFFAGLSVPEAAAVLSVSERTVKRDWRFGRAWLLRAMEAED